MQLPSFSLDLSSLGEANRPDPGTIYDLLILGGGPAAMTAAVYAARKMMKVALLTKDFGGQMSDTSEIENYMGFQAITGRELAEKFQEQVGHFDIPIGQGEKVSEVRREDGLFKVLLESGTTFATRTVILATGKRSWPRWISPCTCRR